jgi:sulfate permease, SulP family
MESNQDKDAPHSRRDTVRADLFAGLTVAVVAVPQSMALAILAGAPPVFGLYTSIVSCLVGAAFGSSRHLVTGPTNATAIMFAATLAGRDGSTDMLAAICLYTFLIGAFKFAFGLFRLGRLTDYISDSVIVGFTAGAGILIAGNQLKQFLGVTTAASSGHGFLRNVLDSLQAADTTNPYAVAIALGTVVTILGLQRVDRRVPGALLAYVGGAAAVYAFDLGSKGVVTAGDLAAIPPGLPGFTRVPFDMDTIQRLAGGAFAVAVIGLMEATSISTAIATRSGQRLNTNREFMAQGLANMVGAFFSNFASSGSLTRSALNYQSGARTRMASAFSGVFVAVVLVSFGSLGEYIPIASLAGLLMVVAYQMVDRSRLRLALRAGRESAIVLVATMAATLALRIDLAIYLGVILSFMFFIHQSSKAYLTVLLPAGDKGFREVPPEEVDEGHVTGKVVLVNIIGAMYFGASDDYVSQIRAIAACRPGAIVIRLRRVSNIDSSGLAAIEGVHDDLRAQGIPLLVCGIDDRLLRILTRSGLVEKIGSERVIASHDLMFNSVRETMDLAESLIASGDESAGTD